ncbi:MAG: hypothetical protein ACJ73E_17645 [Mycobacteriales bacterium]
MTAPAPTGGAVLPASDSARSAYRRLLRDRRAQRGEHSWVTVLDSGSMRPVLDGRCEVLVRWGRPGPDLAPGTLALLESNDEVLVVHRVAEVRTGKSSTDVLQVADNGRPDEQFASYRVQADRVLGVVLAVRRAGAVVDLRSRAASAGGRAVAWTERTVRRLLDRRGPGAGVGPAARAAWRLQRLACHVAYQLARSSGRARGGAAGG